MQTIFLFVPEPLTAHAVGCIARDERIDLMGFRPAPLEGTLVEVGNMRDGERLAALMSQAATDTMVA